MLAMGVLVPSAGVRHSVRTGINRIAILAVSKLGISQIIVNIPLQATSNFSSTAFASQPLIKEMILFYHQCWLEARACDYHLAWLRFK